MVSDPSSLPVLTGPDKSEPQSGKHTLSDDFHSYGLRGKNLQGVSVGAHEFAKDRDVGAVDTDTAGIDGEAQTFGEIEIHTGVVEFRKAVALRWRHTIEAGRIDRPGRTMTAPRAARQFVELLPIAFLPSGHGDHRWCRAVEERAFRLQRSIVD